MKKFIDKLIFNEKELIPAIIQDYQTKRVLTLCYMNKDALLKTVEEGKVYVFRRSQNKLMMKGATSGNVQVVRAIFVDCENKSLLIIVDQKVAGCHAGYFSCYFTSVDKDGNVSITDEKVFDPNAVYRKG